MYLHITTLLLSLFTFIQGSYAQAPPANTKMVFRNEGGRYNGYYLHAFHVAAGISIPTLESEISSAASVAKATGLEILGDSSLIVATRSQIPFYIRLLTDSDQQFAPPGYHSILIDATTVADEFELSQPGNHLSYTGPGSEDIVFAACPVSGIPPYESQGARVVVFWKRRDTAGLEECVEVDLVAQF